MGVSSVGDEVRWTPADWVAMAMSARELMSSFFCGQAARILRARSASSDAGKSFSRSWMWVAVEFFSWVTRASADEKRVRSVMV